MASYTSTQSGDWNTNSTWGGSGHPVAGDTATIGTHTITCSGSCAVGASGATGSFAITHHATGTLTINAGATLTIFGDLDITDGFVNVNGTLTINSPAGSQYKVISRFGNAKSFNCVGTSGAHAVITTAGLGSHGYVDLGASTAVAASSNINYCDVSNLGDATNGFQVASCSGGTFDCATITVANLTVVGSGPVTFGYGGGTNGKEIFTIDGLDIRTPVGSLVLSILDQNTLVSPGVRTRNNITVYNGSGSVKSVRIWDTDATYTNLILVDTAVDMSNLTDRTTVDGYALISDIEFSGSQFVSVSPNAGVVWQNGLIYHHFYNPHTFQGTGSAKSVSPNTYQYNVCDGDGFWGTDSGDFVIPSGAQEIAQYNIGLNKCGTMWSSLFNIAAATITFNHNTWFNSFGGSLGETNGAATQLLSMQSNLIVNPAGNNINSINGDGVHQSGNNFVRQSTFTMDYNAFWQIPSSGDAGSPTASLPDHLSLSYVGFPQAQLPNLTNKTATTGTTATNIASTGSDFVTNGVQAGDYVVKGTFPNGTTTARVTAIVDLHNLTVTTGSGIGNGDVFDVVKSYSATAGAKYGDAGFGLHDVHANPNFTDSTRSLCTWSNVVSGLSFNCAAQGNLTPTTGTNATTIVCSACTFQTWGIDTSDTVVVHTNVGVLRGTSNVVSVDSQTQITINSISGTTTTDIFSFLTPVRNLGRAMVTLNGYDYTGATTTPVSGATVDAGLSYIRAGFTPTNTAIANASSDGIYIGALPVAAESFQSDTFENDTFQITLSGTTYEVSITTALTTSIGDSVFIGSFPSLTVAIAAAVSTSNFLNGVGNVALPVNTGHTLLSQLSAIASTAYSATLSISDSVTNAAQGAVILPVTTSTSDSTTLDAVSSMAASITASLQASLGGIVSAAMSLSASVGLVLNTQLIANGLITAAISSGYALGSTLSSTSQVSIGASLATSSSATGIFNTAVSIATHPTIQSIGNATLNSLIQAGISADVAAAVVKQLSEAIAVGVVLGVAEAGTVFAFEEGTLSATSAEVTKTLVAATVVVVEKLVAGSTTNSF